MARLRRNKERPPQTVQVHITLEQQDILRLAKKDRAEPYYKVLDRMLERIAELEFLNEDLKQSLKENRELRKRLEERIENFEAKEYEKGTTLPRFTR